MKPSEQTNVIEFLKNLLPQEYYCVANGDYVEVHKIDVDDPSNKIIEPPNEIPKAWFDGEYGGY